MENFKRVIKLFLTMFKIGLFTFGGGYAMVSVIEREIVERKKWVNYEEFLDLIAISESSPGPLAVNSATFIGYKIARFWGSFFATLGVVLPSFIIIFIVAFFYKQFLEIEYVKYAFMGIQACVAFLIINAGVKMLKHLKKNMFNLVLFFVALIGFVLITIFKVEFSAIYFIILGGLIGLIFYFISLIKAKRNQKKEKGDE